MTPPDNQEFEFLPAYAIAIAEAANSWAALEYEVNTTIWSLAETAPAIGACLTSQIFTMNARLDALVSLLNLRSVDAAIIKKTNQFASSVREAQEARNRIVHDYWMNDRSQPTKMGKLVITAQKLPRFTIRTIPLEELQADVNKIHEKRYEFGEAKAFIIATLPSLPPIPHIKLHPIIESR